MSRDISTGRFLLSHGYSKHPSNTYTVWMGMRRRCDNPSMPNYSSYGGRGITYDPAWKCFENFLMDMGNRPAGLSLDRIDNNGNYTKANCRWANPTEQANNTRRNRLLTINNETHTLSEWSRITGVRVGTIWDRLEKGRLPEDCISKRRLQHRASL